MLPLNSSRHAAFLVCVCLWCVLAGCKPAAAPPTAPGQPPADARRQPSTGDLANFVRAGLPPTIKLVELKNDPPVPLPGSAPGSNAWLYNVRFTFAPAEDELGPASPQDTQAFQALVGELNGLIAWSQAYAQSPYASLYPGFTVEPPVPASPQLLRVIHAKGQPHPPIYGKLAAEWQVDHWQFSVEDAALPQGDGSKFRSEFTGPILIQGEAATNRYLAGIKAAIAQAAPKKEAIERRYQEDLAKATQPGTVYTGQISRKDHKSIPVEVRFTAPTSNDSGLARFELKLPASGYVYTCSAKLARQVPNLPAESTAADSSFTTQAEPVVGGDLTMNYEHVNSPKFNLADDLANDLLYNHSGVNNMPLELRDHQLTGKLTNLPYNFLVLSVRQSP